MKTMNTNGRPNPAFLSLFPMLLAWSSLSVQAATTESNLSKAFPVHPGGVLIMDVDRGPIQVTTEDTS